MPSIAVDIRIGQGECGIIEGYFPTFGLGCVAVHNKVQLAFVTFEGGPGLERGDIMETRRRLELPRFQGKF